MGSQAAVGPRKVALPHRAELERAFGERLDGIQAYTGAGKVLDRLGAHAAASGDVLAFADQQPDLYTAAHEVAHVLQHRGAGGSAPSGVGPVGGPAEVDADRAADAVAAGESASVSAAPGGDVQLLPKALKKLFGKKPKPVVAPQEPFKIDTARKGDWGMNDADVDTSKPIVKGAGGSLNRVDRVHYKGGIGSSGAKMGFFKPGYGKKAQQAAIASTRLDSMMGFGLQPTEYMATHGGETGTVSPQVKGSSIYEAMFTLDVPVPQGKTAEEMVEGRSDRKLVNGQVKGFAGALHVAHHDLTDPTTQRGLADLQLEDAILGQIDRHGANIYIDDASGRVRGIDNDQILKWDDVLADPEGHYLGLPSQVDAATAARVLRLDADDLLTGLSQQLRHAGADQTLPDAFKASFKQRLTDVQAHVRGLEQQNKLITTWDQSTYQAALGEADYDNGKNGTWHRTSERSYLKRAKNQYDSALRGDNGSIADPAPVVMPPLPAIPQATVVKPKRPARKGAAAVPTVDLGGGKGAELFRRRRQAVGNL